jgi:hypothetical protein
MKRAVLAAAVVLVFALPVASGAVPTVYCDPETVTVDSAEVFQIAVMVTGLDTLANYQAIFSYDYSVLEYVAAYEGSLYATSGLQTWFLDEEESLGTYEVWDVIFPALTYVLPPGELFRVEFRALRTGTTPIEFLSVALTDRYREGIAPIAWSDGFVVAGDMAGVGVDDTGNAGQLGLPWPNPTSAGVILPVMPGEEPGHARISADVYDSRGRFVAGLISESGSGAPAIRWNGRDGEGREVPAGVYYIRASEAGAVSRKVVLIR